jgi:selenocysteine lyase/cysteine desulfurase
MHPLATRAYFPFLFRRYARKFLQEFQPCVSIEPAAMLEAGTHNLLHRLAATSEGKFGLVVHEGAILHSECTLSGHAKSELKDLGFFLLLKLIDLFNTGVCHVLNFFERVLLFIF